MFKHFIGVDWSQSVMAISRRTASGKEVQLFQSPADVKELRYYLKNLKGPIALTFEESTGATWLYAQIYDCVSKLIVCDPYRNKLLSTGTKTDLIDASKLSRLLHANMLHPVFHTTNRICDLRKIVSGYEDLIKSGVRSKNQISAVHRGIHNHKPGQSESFVLKGYKEYVEFYESERERYKKEFERFAKKYKPIRDVKSIPGIGIVGAVQVIATVIDPSRFSCAGKFLSYAGLITLSNDSGGRSYGRRKPRYSRTLKHVFDTAAMSIINGNESALKNYYLYLIRNKNYAKHNAKKALARRISSITYGVLKTGNKYNEEKIKN